MHGRRRKGDSQDDEWRDVPTVFHSRLSFLWAHPFVPLVSD
jgi:hypothetical protein